jgi:hypothetical protein
MSKKKKADLVSDSNLPDGGFVPTNGWNYGLDGFDFDMDYGDGVEDAARLPEAYGLSDLPDGLVPDPDEDHEAGVVQVKAPLSDMMANPWGMSNMASEEDLRNAGNLADIDWLDPTMSQDEDRLPVNPVDKGIEELTEAWGVNRRTDGVSLVPNRDKEIVDYQNSVRDPGKTSLLPGTDKDVDWRKAAVCRAMRRSSYGEPLRDVLSELGKDTAGRFVAEEHGLAGRVFIRAAAFPGMINGKWDKTIKRRCRTAAFIVAAKGSKMAARENYLGKKVVQEVPWKRALEMYKPRLVASGVKLGSGDPREVLKQAFIKGPSSGRKDRTASLPTHQAETMSLTKAEQAFAEHQTVREVFSHPGQRDVLTQRVAMYVNTLVEKGRVSAEFGRGLLLSGDSNKSILDAVTQELGKARTETYAGTGVGASEHRSTHKSSTSSGDVLASQLIRAERQITDLVERGLITTGQAARILESGISPAEMARQAGQLAVTGDTVAKQYDGPEFTRAVATKKVVKRSAHDLRILEASKTSGIKAKEFRSLIRWARQQMSEGLAGTDLDLILSARFSNRLLKAAKSLMGDLRGTHEGLSGHVYTDTEAYSSPTGTNGCDKGANVHRANALKFALCMPRCGTCKFASTLPSGEEVCQKYNKILVDRPPVEDPKEYQRLALRQYNASDAEVTASLFTANWNSEEYSLGNENMTNINFDETPDSEQLAGLVFGGLLLGDDDE